MGDHECCRKNNAHKHGFFKRKSDGRIIQRYRCISCGTCFSSATNDPQFGQKKRHINYSWLMMLASMMSMRRIAIILNVQRHTIANKLIFLANQSRKALANQYKTYPKVSEWQFDELQTIEHTKCKPLSVVLAVAEDNRKILGFYGSTMPASGPLASLSREKYGSRKNDRKKGIENLFIQLKDIVSDKARISSDECSLYKPLVKHYFPKSKYHQYKGKKSSVSGQGELKKTYHDPLFYINHTFAMLRANINRLIRKTWCTTKKMKCLIDHLAIYVWVHNNKLTHLRYTIEVP